MDSSAPRVFRVLLEVSDRDAAATFYAALLGTEGRPVFGGRTYFDCGGVIVGFVDSATSGREPRPTPQYLYFAVDDLGAVHARVAALGCLSPDDARAGVSGSIATQPWGERSFYATDPDGNLLCFVDAATLFTG